jgi:hypothetical protein
MQLTALTTLIGCIIMFGAWLLVGHRMKHANMAASRQVTLLRSFFAHMGIFTLLMFLPHLWLDVEPERFPAFMAWGYVVGHVFMYYAFLCVGRLFISIIPRFTSKDKPFLIIGLLATTAATIFNAITMIWGKQPQYSEERGVTLLNAHPVVGATIGLFALICIMPMAVLMIRNGIRNPESRVRSFLLGGGLLLMVLGGPMHDVAQTASMYVLADFVTSLSFIVIASGVAYKIEERISVARPAMAPAA